jgi:hypothetical protein
MRFLEVPPSYLRFEAVMAMTEDYGHTECDDV